MAELAQDALEPPNRDGDVDESTLIAIPHLAQRVSGRGEEVHHDDVWGEPAIEQGSHEIRGDLVARGADGVEVLAQASQQPEVHSGKYFSGLASGVVESTSPTKQIG